MGADPLAGNGGHSGPATCPLCRAVGGRGPALEMRPHPVQRLRLAGRYRILANVWLVSLLLGGCRGFVHLTGRLPGLHCPRDLPTNVLLHYTQCEPGHTNPFTQRLRESQNSLNNARSAMATVMKISLVLFKSSGLQPKLGAVNADLNSSERLLTQLTALVDCKAVHHNFLAAARDFVRGPARTGPDADCQLHCSHTPHDHGVGGLARGYTSGSGTTTPRWTSHPTFPTRHPRTISR